MLENLTKIFQAPGFFFSKFVGQSLMTKVPTYSFWTKLLAVKSDKFENPQCKVSIPTRYFKDGFFDRHLSHGVGVGAQPSPDPLHPLTGSLLPCEPRPSSHAARNVAGPHPCAEHCHRDGGGDAPPDGTDRGGLRHRGWAAAFPALPMRITSFVFKICP